MKTVPATKNLFFVLLAFNNCAYGMVTWGGPFYVREVAHWSAGAISLLQIAVGALIGVAAVRGGQLVERWGWKISLCAGFSGVLLSTLLGLLLPVPWNAIAATLVIACANGFIAPAISFVVTVGEDRRGLQRQIGVFSLVWSTANAVAVFALSPAMHHFGARAAYGIPLVMVLLGWGGLLVVHRNYREEGSDRRSAVVDELKHLSEDERALFRLLGWLANPLSYVAIIVVAAYSPLVGERHHLSVATASSWLSVWYYFRIASFELFRRWSGWCFKPKLLCAGFTLLMLSGIGILALPTVPLLLLAQVIFGVGAGFLYQSSLFYSMATSCTRARHGGVHESFVGVGMAGGAVLGVLGGYLTPGSTLGAAMMLGVSSVVGLALLVRITRRLCTA